MYSNIFEYLCHRIYSYSYSVFIFESNIFVFVFYFLVECIRIRFLFFKRIYSYSYSVVKILFAHLCLSPTRFNSLHIAQCTSLRSGLVGGCAFWASRHKLPVPYLKVGYKSHPRSLWVIFDPFKVNNSSVYTTLRPIHKKLRHYLVILGN